MLLQQILRFILSAVVCSNKLCKATFYCLTRLAFIEMLLSISHNDLQVVKVLGDSLICCWSAATFAPCPSDQLQAENEITDTDTEAHGANMWKCMSKDGVQTLQNAINKIYGEFPSSQSRLHIASCKADVSELASDRYFISGRIKIEYCKICLDTTGCMRFHMYMDLEQCL